MSETPDENLKNDGSGPPDPVNLVTGESVKLVEAHIVGPSEDQVQAGRARLANYLPRWLTTPAFLIVKPHTALIVSVRDYLDDEMGFTLQLHVEETLMAYDIDPTDDTAVSCGWNQPYMSFSASVIHAAYCFTLYFGAEGVAHARELHAILSQVPRRPNVETCRPTIFRSCFRANGGEYVRSLRAIYLGTPENSA